MLRNPFFGSRSKRSISALGAPAILCCSVALKSALLGTSALVAMGLTSPPAYADCNLPVLGEDENGDPIVITPITNGDTVTCASDHATGLNTSASNVTININSGVTVSGSPNAIDFFGNKDARR